MDQAQAGASSQGKTNPEENQQAKEQKKMMMW